MSIFKRLSDLFSGGDPSDPAAYWLQVRCDQCGEVIRTRVDLRNELSLQYDQQGNPAGYLCRKTMVGSNQCFRRIEVELRFDTRRRLIERHIQGGMFVDPAP